MLGAIIGDIVGSRFEWNNIKTKDFDFFAKPMCLLGFVIYSFNGTL
jgi:ADP-ribosylglycohydrolase